MAVNIAKLVVENYEDKEVFDYLDDCFKVIKRDLDGEGNLEFNAGVAAVNIDIVRSILKAYREKKFGEKPTQVL